MERFLKKFWNLLTVLEIGVTGKNPKTSGVEKNTAAL